MRPANSSASAGPLPYAGAPSAHHIDDGDLGQVEKYISAPSTEAIIVEARVLSPTATRDSTLRE